MEHVLLSQDHNDSIDVSELQYLVAAMGKPVNPRSVWHMMECIDARPPWGTISLAEWVEYHHKMCLMDSLTEDDGAPTPTSLKWQRMQKTSSSPKIAGLVYHEWEGTVPYTVCMHAMQRDEAYVAIVLLHAFPWQALIIRPQRGTFGSCSLRGSS